ncbi:MAG: ATP-binding protein [Haloarculaceae archaeon]
MPSPPDREAGAVSVVLDEPRTAVVVSADADRREEIAAALTARDAVEAVVTVADAASLGATLDERSDAGCVLIAAGPSGDPAAVARAAREDDPARPVVALVETLDAEAGAAAAGPGTILPADVTDERLAAVVADAVDAYVHRRIAAEDSEILRTFLEESGIPLYAKDAEARHVRVPEIPGGLDPEEALGKTDPEVYDDTESSRQSLADDRQVIEEGEGVYQRDEKFGEGEIQYWSRTTKVPWRGEDGEMKGLVGLSQDVTEWKLQEQELRELRNQFEEFASHLSHDLQTPLQVADGYLDLAAAGDESALEEARAALGRMEETISDLEQLARQRGPAGTPEPIALREVVEEVWNPLADDGATLRFTAPAGTTIRAARQAIRPVLENLFKNALDHGGPDVTVEVGVHGSGFYVADDGPGIPPEKRDRVTEEGYTTSDEGSGTGLSMVQSIVEQNHWRLTITESDAGGARFEIGNCQAVSDPDPGLAVGAPVDLADEAAVGDLRKPGFAEYDADADRWTVAGDGEDIFLQNNDFYFPHAVVEGPVTIRARLVDVEDVHEYSKAGLMVRDDLDEAAAYGTVGRTPGHGTELLWRHERGADGLSQQLEEGEIVFDHYRVDRVGDRVTTYVSEDGSDWEAVDQRTVALGDPVHVGLVVSSVVPGHRAEAVFEDVSVNRLEE